MTVALDTPFRLDPLVALRPERFGALAYHFGNRRLSFVKHPDLVAVLERADGATTVEAALVAVGVDESRWPSFLAALETLERSEVVRVAVPVGEAAAS